MGDFKVWLTNEMAQVTIQNKGDRPDRAPTTHYGYPVWSPTIYYLLQNRNELFKNPDGTPKYPNGMTVDEIFDALMEKSELRSELGPDEKMPENASNWKEDLMGPSREAFKRGIRSMLELNAKKGKLSFTTIAKSGGRGPQQTKLWLPSEQSLSTSGIEKIGPRKKKEVTKPVNVFQDMMSKAQTSPSTPPPVEEEPGSNLEDLAKGIQF